MSINKDETSALSVDCTLTSPANPTHHANNHMYIASEDPIKEDSHSKSPSFIARIFHKNPSEKRDKEEIPPRLQEAIKQMEERKAAKMEEMERDGKKPNKGTVDARGHAVAGAVSALGSLGTGLG